MQAREQAADRQHHGCQDVDGRGDRAAALVQHGDVAKVNAPSTPTTRSTPAGSDVVQASLRAIDAIETAIQGRIAECEPVRRPTASRAQIPTVAWTRRTKRKRAKVKIARTPLFDGRTAHFCVTARNRPPIACHDDAAPQHVERSEVPGAGLTYGREGRRSARR
jgi:hypothetical protein